ncbi:hypothetical protein [Rhizobium leguminosarum]|uniref:hypothetical protein n=1 Tax=Rhizobium leguminosarum TaxID=384 RepID=UPI003F9466EE
MKIDIVFPLFSRIILAQRVAELEEKMGACTVECAISVGPEEFVKKFREELSHSTASEGLEETRFRQDAEDERHLFIDLQWVDLTTARANLASVKAMLGQDVRVMKEPTLQTNVGPIILTR